MNTDYLLSLNEEDAEREQKMLYRYTYDSHHSVSSKKVKLFHNISVWTGDLVGQLTQIQ